MMHGKGMLLDGKYRLHSCLGQGGMASVYLAEDLTLGRYVAVKLVRNVECALGAERLFREAKAAARTNHPCVVTIYGYGTDPDECIDYLVMERLEGEDVAARVARCGAFAVDALLRLSIDVADALAAAHAVGVIHRDLKPANLFLARRGLRSDETKVLDFGIAKHLDLHSITAPGQLLGTLPYTAPERLLDAQQVDPATDIYALGVTMFECLAGVLPFTAQSPAEMIRQILARDGESLIDLRPDLPPALVATITRCMAREPSQRFASARDVCSALQQLEEQRPG